MKLWQKLAAMAVLAVFILSIVPMALAKSNGESGGKGGISLPNIEIEKQMEEQTAAGSEAKDGMPSMPGLPLAQEKLDKEEVKSREKQEKLQEKLEKEREKAAEKMAKIQEKLQENKEKFLEEKVKFEEKRQEFLEGKGALISLREAARCKEDTDECQAKKMDLKRGMKQHLANTVELIERSLLKLQAKVEASRVLSEEEKQDALDRIAALEEKLTAKKEEVLALGDEVSGAELKKQIKDLKKLWQEVRKEQRRILADLISNKQEDIVGSYGHFAEQMQERIAKLQEKGADIDVSELETLLAAFRTKIDALQEAQETARTAWKTAKEEGTKEAVQAAREKQEQFKLAMKEARTALRELLMKYKELKIAIEIGEMEMQPGVPSPVRPLIVPSEPVAEAGVPAAAESAASLPTADDTSTGIPTPLPTPLG